MTSGARHVQEARVTAALMATTLLVKTVSSVPMMAAKRVLTTAVVACAYLGTGDQRVTTRVVQDVCVK